MRVCDFPECGRKHEARGLCRAHYYQQRCGQALRPLTRHGSPEWRALLAAATRAKVGEEASHWRGDEVRYAGAHQRHRKSMDLSRCVACGSTERVEAALRWDVPKERIRRDAAGSERGLAYSLESTDYVALCRTDHRTHDSDPAVLITRIVSKLS